jgi:hypothetical protein
VAASVVTRNLPGPVATLDGVKHYAGRIFCPLSVNLKNSLILMLRLISRLIALLLPGTWRIGFGKRADLTSKRKFCNGFAVVLHKRVNPHFRRRSWSGVGQSISAVRSLQDQNI